MLEYSPPVADYQFLIHRYLAIQSLANEVPAYADYEPEYTNAIYDEAGRLCVQELLPLNRIGDEQGCELIEERVKTPEGFGEAYAKLIEGGWIGLSGDPRYGGQGLPGLLAMPLAEMLVSANFGLSGYVDITQAAARTISIHGSVEQKNKYLSKLISGEWGGAMALTEPQAGTDLGLVSTRAVRREDGMYEISGAKIFITGSDQDLTDNIVILTLARIENSPGGTKGLSLFIVPRVNVSTDGKLLDRNSVSTVAVEHKMGARGSATCAISYENAIGELVGEEQEGLVRMFTMMNDTRLGVSLQGLGIAEVAYQNALAYARDRRQGRAPEGENDPRGDLIIRHPDVQQMLLKMRSFVEGGRALAVYTAYMLDLVEHAADPHKKEAADDRIALLTPAMKAYFTDQGFESANLAIQCYGGHGYISEWGVEQLVRDVRVTQLYEGTNGVQALDLCMRKIRMKGGAVIQEFIDEMNNVSTRLAQQGLRDMRAALDRIIARLAEVTESVSGLNRERLSVVASHYLALFSRAMMSWIWCDLITCATPEAAAEKEQLDSKTALAVYYVENALPEVDMYAEKCLHLTTLPSIWSH